MLLHPLPAINKSVADLRVAVEYSYDCTRTVNFQIASAEYHQALARHENLQSVQRNRREQMTARHALEGKPTLTQPQQGQCNDICVFVSLAADAAGTDDMGGLDDEKPAEAAGETYSAQQQFDIELEIAVKKDIAADAAVRAKLLADNSSGHDDNDILSVDDVLVPPVTPSATPSSASAAAAASPASPAGVPAVTTSPTPSSASTAAAGSPASTASVPAVTTPATTSSTAAVVSPASTAGVPAVTTSATPSTTLQCRFCGGGEFMTVPELIAHNVRERELFAMLLAS